MMSMAKASLGAVPPGVTARGSAFTRSIVSALSAASAAVQEWRVTRHAGWTFVHGRQSVSAISDCHSKESSGVGWWERSLVAKGGEHPRQRLLQVLPGSLGEAGLLGGVTDLLLRQHVQLTLVRGREQRLDAVPHPAVLRVHVRVLLVQVGLRELRRREAD